MAVMLQPTFTRPRFARAVRCYRAHTGERRWSRGENLLPIEVMQPKLDSEGKKIESQGQTVWESVSQIRFCRWLDAFDANLNFIPGFTDQDRDRFKIRLKIDGANTASIAVNLSTTGDMWTDNPTRVEFTKTQDGFYETPGLILCADPIDGEHPLAGNNNNQSNDRSHVGSLNGKVRQSLLVGSNTSQESDLITAMQSTHVLDVQAVILDLPNDEILSHEQEAIAEEHLRIAEEVWAQVGVKVKYSVITIPASGSILSLLSDYTVNSDTAFFNQSSEDGQILQFVKDRVPGNKAVLIYLPSFVNTPNGSVAGISYYGHPASWQSQFRGYVLVSGRQLRAAQPYGDYLHNAAHELGHAIRLLHARDSFPQSRPMNHLMKEGGGNLYFYLIDDAKRLDHADMIKAKGANESYFKSSQP